MPIDGPSRALCREWQEHLKRIQPHGMLEQDFLTPTESITMPPKPAAAAAPVPESVLKKQAATKKSAEDRAKQQAARKQVGF